LNAKGTEPSFTRTPSSKVKVNFNSVRLEGFEGEGDGLAVATALGVGDGTATEGMKVGVGEARATEGSGVAVGWPDCAEQPSRAKAAKTKNSLCIFIKFQGTC